MDARKTLAILKEALMDETCGPIEVAEPKEGMCDKLPRGRLKRFEDGPYRDPDAKTHQFHAVFQDKHGSTLFLSAPTAEGLKVGLSSLDNVKKVIAIYAGQLIDFHEERAVTLKGF